MKLYTSMSLRACIEGVKHNTPKFFRLFLGSCSTYPEHFMKIPSCIFP